MARYDKARKCPTCKVKPQWIIMTQGVGLKCPKCGLNVQNLSETDLTKIIMYWNMCVRSIERSKRNGKKKVCN